MIKSFVKIEKDTEISITTKTADGTAIHHHSKPGDYFVTTVTGTQNMIPGNLFEALLDSGSLNICKGSGS